MVSQKAGGAMLGSSILVMAWTGVYFSRQPRNVSETDSFPVEKSSFNVYEVINGTDYYNFTMSQDNERRNTIKQVEYCHILFCNFLNNFNIFIPNCRNQFASLFLEYGLQ